MGGCDGYFCANYQGRAARFDHVIIQFNLKPGCLINIMDGAMVVGRCKDCVWWDDSNTLASAVSGKRVKSSCDWGKCVRVREEDTLMDDEEYGVVDTNAFFGCVMWESNE